MQTDDVWLSIFYAVKAMLVVKNILPLRLISNSCWKCWKRTNEFKRDEFKFLLFLSLDMMPL